MIDLTNPQNIDLIASIIKTNNFKKIVLQLNKKLLAHSFWLTSKLRSLCPTDVQFYTLYDSLRNPCCSDIINAKHVDYDVLFHFGYACFSQKYQQNHYYILPQLPIDQCQKLKNNLLQEQTINNIKINKISLILCDQSIYNNIIKIKQNIQKLGNVQIAKLPFHQVEGDCYFGFSYYCKSQSINRNILVIKPNSNSSKTNNIFLQKQPQNLTSDLLLQNLSLCKKHLNIQKIFTLTPTQPITQYTQTSNKRLIQRISQISQLTKYTIFGILVSNPSTKFCQYTIKYLRYLFQRKGLKYFIFMMNNLNQCKLGNFPQIQVYVVISCYNYSLYVSKDFCRLVVSPYDICIAFGDGNYQLYQFDLNALKYNQNYEESSNYESTTACNEKQLTIQNKQVIIHNSIQTLDSYRGKLYKGLNLQQKKQVQKIKKGRIGTATSYLPISDESKTNQ